MQGISSYIERQAEDQWELLYLLDDLITSSAHGVISEIKWKIPFYSYRGPLCYINAKDSRIEIGFLKGYLLKSHLDYLVHAKTKLVRHIHISSMEDFKQNVDKIEAILQEAILLAEPP